MTRLRTFELPSFAATRSDNSTSVGILGLLQMACMVCTFCVATAIVSPAQTWTVLRSFSYAASTTDGDYPRSALIQATDGNFYGTTAFGGVDRSGTIFRITPTGTLTTLYRFCSQTNCTDGAQPVGALIQATNGNFYGTTSEGGASTNCDDFGCGTIFEITAGGTLSTLYSFCLQANCPDGALPISGLVQATDENFYGTTLAGGIHKSTCNGFGCGTFFKITAGGSLTTLYSFCSQANCTDGVPNPGLIQATDGNFYGTTGFGGVNTNGSVFRITPTGTLTTLYSFCSQTNCADGSVPQVAVIQAADGNFYGTTGSGGANAKGTAFRLTPTGTLTTLYSFCSQVNCTDGADPTWLIQASDGNFYGTTTDGGAVTYYGGTVFELTAEGTLSTLYSLCSMPECRDGADPQGLSQGSDGNFYGTTSSGGSCNSRGTVFSLSPVPTAVTLSPTSLDFCSQTLDETGVAKTATVTNTGPVTLDLSSITASGNFEITKNTCTATLAIGKKCQLSVIFTPSALSLQSGTITFTDNAANSPQTLPLSGIAIAQATLVPAGLTFGRRKVGTTSGGKKITLKNNLPTTLTGISYKTNSSFTISDSTCSTTLGSKETCTISVAFSPTATGTAAGTLTVTDSANNSPQTVSLTNRHWLLN